MRLRHLFNTYLVLEALEAPENDEDDFGEGDDNLITRIYVLGDDDIYVEVLLANSGKRYYRVTSYSKPRVNHDAVQSASTTPIQEMRSIKTTSNS